MFLILLNTFTTMQTKKLPQYLTKYLDWVRNLN